MTRKELISSLAEHIERQPWNSPFDTPAHDALMRVLPFHPRAREKEGVGIAMFYKKPSANGYPIVYLRRLDLSADDFDWQKAATWATRTDRSRWLDYSDGYHAFRREIEPQIEDYRNALRRIAIAAGQAGYFRSDLSHEWVPEKDCQIDHIYPATFATLVATFVQLERSDLKTVQTFSAYPAPGRLLVDRDLAARWRAFHWKNARLRVLSKQENIRESFKSPRLVDLLNSCSAVLESSSV